MCRLLLCLSICLLTAPDSLPRTRSHKPAPIAAAVDTGDKLPDDAGMVRLAKTDPIAFLEKCLIRHDREITGYRVNFKKQERVKGKLLPVEEIIVDYRDKPFSVLFDYGPKPLGKAQRVLYVKPDDEKDRGKLLVLPAGWRALAGIVERNLDDADALETNRCMMDEFGLKKGCQRTFAAWRASRDNKTLHVEYLGEKKVAELEDRTCWALHRTCDKPEEDGITDVVLYFDKKTWQQTGAVLKDHNGDLIAEYWFRIKELNPKFDENTFTRQSLKK